MTVVKRGEAWLEQNYKSTQELAMEKMLEQKKAESERIKRLNDELLKLEFDEWFTNLNEQAKNEIFEEVLSDKERNVIHTLPQNIQEKSLIKHYFNYFKQKVKCKGMCTK